MRPYFYVSFSSGGIERVGDWEFERKLERLAKQCRGEFNGSGFGFGVRDYGFIFKTRQSAERFYAELGRRAHSWKVSNRYIDHVIPDEE